MISPSLASNFYLGYALGATAEYPAILVFCILINRIGRKKCLCIFFLISGITLLTSVPFQTSLTDQILGKYWINLVLCLTGRLCTTVCYAVIYLYTNELFPTCVRNTGYGLTSASIYFGILVSPYTRTWARHVPWAPNVLFGVICMAVPLAIICFPETRDQELPQTLKDIEVKSEEIQESTKMH